MDQLYVVVTSRYLVNKESVVTRMEAQGVHVLYGRSLLSPCEHTEVVGSGHIIYIECRVQ